MYPRTLIVVVALATTFLGLARYATATSGPGAELPPIPALTGWVNDNASVLTTAERERLSNMLAGFHRETHHQLAVLIVQSLSGEPLEHFSLRVANTWALGYKGLDNGILVILAMNERSVRIELGKGMERHISDDQAKAIIDGSMVPAFRKGDLAGGLEAGLQRLMKEARRYVVRSTDLQGKPDGS